MSSGCRYTTWMKKLLLALLILSVSATASATPSIPASESFARGSHYWSVTGGTSRDRGLGWLYFTQLGLQYYIADNLAVTCGGIVGYMDARRADDGLLAGPEAGLRWHFAEGNRWSMYLDGVVGEVFQEHALTPARLRFSFDIQLGIGATYHVSRTLLYQSGLRWHHLSNGQIRGKDRNGGYDAPMLYLGLARSF